MGRFPIWTPSSSMNPTSDSEVEGGRSSLYILKSKYRKVKDELDTLESEARVASSKMKNENLDLDSRIKRLEGELVAKAVAHDSEVAALSSRAESLQSDLDGVRETANQKQEEWNEEKKGHRRQLQALEEELLSNQTEHEKEVRDSNEEKA